MPAQLEMTITVPVGREVDAARQIWSICRALEREVLARLAAEIVLLREGTSDQRVIVAPAAELEAMGLPIARREQ